MPSPPLQLRTVAAFRQDPRDGVVTGEGWMYFCLEPSLFGYALWGSPGVGAVRALADLMELQLDGPPHAVVVDLGGLTGASPEAFEVLASYATTHAAALARVVTRAAVVRPAGLHGAIVSGFFDVASRPFPVTLWPTVEGALSHLGADVAGGVERLSEARARAADEPLCLRELRALLLSSVPRGTADPGALTVTVAARALGMTTRTLQRRLAASGTSFQAEVDRARLEVALRRLGEPGTPVTHIALDLGFATPQHFATWFRRQTGESPTGVRRRS